MHVSQIGTAYAVEDPSAAGAWMQEHLGFQLLLDLQWYASTLHPVHPELRVDFVRLDHPTWVTPAAGVSGAMLALVVPDVDHEHERLISGGAGILKPLATEPWGQRRFQVAGPGGLVIELVQVVEPDPAWLAEQTAGAGG